MITLDNLKNILEDTTLLMFNNYSAITDNIKTNVALFKVFLADELWNDASIRNIDDSASSSVLSNIKNGKHDKKTGTEAFKKDVANIIINNPSVIDNSVKKISNMTKKAQINKTAFQTGFRTYLNKNCTISSYPENYVQYLHDLLNNKPDEFLLWLHLGAILQDKIKMLSTLFHNSNIKYKADSIHDYLKKSMIPVYTAKGSSLVADIPEHLFWELRRTVILNCGKELILSGQSLMDAFDINNSKNLLTALYKVIEDSRLEQLKIIITDPSIFSIKPSCNRPLLDIEQAVTTIIDDLLKICQRKHCHVDLYFVPLLEIDHAVITDDYMLLRTTKLWTRDRKYKGAFGLYQNIETTEGIHSEYEVQKTYMEVVMSNCTSINPNSDIYEKTDSLAMEKHNQWRKKIATFRYDCISLHKLYNSQLLNYVANGWTNELNIHNSFIPSKDIRCHEDLFNPENLLNDNTQKILLPYIRETQALLNHIVKDYDSSEDSGAIVYPSLDLGFPNNVQRLAGGFATGMFVNWQCGTNIIPVDATVNVCSSSVFRLNNFTPEQFHGDFVEYLNQKIFIPASNNKGYSFSFDSGNHFLMIAKDENGLYYLVLHSSANEFKNSYMGLYPIEGNWYCDKIKTYKQGDRYLRYIKDEEARYFTTNAKHLRTYNEQIHMWLANKMNNDMMPSESIIKHHYYMPTDTSIAIGTFVEEPGTIVPMFSNIGKPIYLFRIGQNNWKISLNGTDKCLVPHGWGQQIDSIQNLYVDTEGNRLYLDNTGISINSKERIDLPDKRVREFKSGEEFLRIGNRMVHGKIEKTLYPEYLFCKSLKGKVSNEY